MGMIPVDNYSTDHKKYRTRRRLEWIKVTLRSPAVSDDSVTDWCDDTIKGHWSFRARMYQLADFYFELEEDAILFTLRWS